MELFLTTGWVEPGKWGGGTASTHVFPVWFLSLCLVHYVLTSFNIKHLCFLTDEELGFLHCPFTAWLGALV